MATVDQIYLREWRLAKGLTQPELAARVGSVKSEISRLENGSRRMTFDWMSALARAMAISVDDLMTPPPQGTGAANPASPARAIPPAALQPFVFGDLTLALDAGHHAVTTINGDDWAGIFQPGDKVIYDTSMTSTAVPGIFVIEVGGETMTRRITPDENKRLVFTCANPAYPPQHFGSEHKVLGRVIARLHRV